MDEDQREEGAQPGDVCPSNPVKGHLSSPVQPILVHNQGLAQGSTVKDMMLRAGRSH